MFLTFVLGLLIGIANIIPGVSGGTFALVLGIYDRLIEALRNLGTGLPRAALRWLLRPGEPNTRAALAAAARRSDLPFLTLLALGALAAIVGCAWVFDYLLRHHPGETLAFFIGLILPSLAVPWRMLTRRTPATLFWALPGGGLTLALALSDVARSGADPSLLFVFAGGVLAVSAMVLPGVSGSFLLLVLGLYQPVLVHIKTLSAGHLNPNSLLFLGVFGAGLVAGLVGFSHVMSFLLRRFRSATLAFLIGLILGSFYVLWPYKDYGTAVADLSRRPAVKLEIQVATAPNRLPGAGDGGRSLRYGLACLLGLLGAAGVERLGRRAGAAQPGGGNAV